MGIRIHKALGWGLKNVKTEKGQIADDRFAPNSILTADYENREQFTTSNYLNWLEANPKQADWLWKSEVEFIRKHLKTQETKDGDFQSCFIHGTEYLMPKVFCCVSLMYLKEWTRYDSIIDYVEVSNGKNKVKTLKNSIFPYFGFWDSRTGKRLDSVAELIYLARDDTLAKTLGFENKAEAEKYIKPMVPEAIQWQLEYAKAFSSPEVVFQMEPMVYTYWS